MQTLSARNMLEGVGPALVHLLRAYRFAHDVQLDRWEFALSLRHLVEMGIGESDLRWLALNGYVEFADECTTFRDATRRFPSEPEYLVQPRDLFCAYGGRTAASFKAAAPQGWLQPPSLVIGRLQPPRQPVLMPYGSPPPRTFGASGSRFDSAANPHWDCKRRVLRLGRCVVKQFHRPAANQETVLAAFQEEGWPDHIDDPLRPSGEHVPRHRLGFTVRRLNDCQTERLIRFFADGTGHGICWERLSAVGVRLGPSSEIRRAA